MSPVYFDTHFKLGLPLESLPDSFAIITAFATTGEVWSDQQNKAANESLRTELESTGVLLGPITGYSRVTNHAEPGFAASVGFEEACRLGAKYKQDAIYYVSGGTLFVSHCDHRRALNPVTRFSERTEAGE